MRRVLFCAIAAAAVIVLVGPAGSASGAGAASSISATLARAQAVLSGRDRTVSDPTMLLRDLAFGVDRLPRAERASAESLLARPGSAQADPRTGGYSAPEHHVCSTHFCVHYVLSSTDAVPLADANGNGVPDWVETNVNVLESLWQKEVVEYGFRPPRSDIDIPNHGPDGRVDVYLADLVDRGILGYCAPERPPNYQSFNASGYCVLDNDYTPAQVGAPGLAGLLELELTAVHEFFHDIQFGYDASDDVWLLEGTATWIEDEAFPNVYEAYNRFPYSALRQPQVPVDFVSATKPYQYGSWVFWRFLEELLAPDASHYAPQVIRRVWELADASPGGPDMYSLQAVEAVLAEHGIPFRTAFLDFALANFRPASFYREGKTWPAAPVQRVQRIGSGGRASATLRLDHLSSRYVAFVPGRGARAGSQLSLNLDLPVLGKAPAAAALVYSRRGAPSTRRIPLSLAGNGSIRVPFGSKQVSRVVLVLVNASDRYRCWGFRSRMSCQGTPLDDKAPYRYSARVS